MRGKHRRLFVSVSEILESRRLLSTYYVDANAPGITQDGSSWEFAFKDLQSALVGKAVTGDTFLVADGTYKPTTTTDRTVSFNLVNGVGIFGGYAGFGASDPEACNTLAYKTILSGDIGVQGNINDNSYHVVAASAVSSTIVLDGVTITLGNANGGNTYQNGGGGMINLSNSAPTLNDCKFIGNMAATYGGGIYCYSNRLLTLTNCAFEGNSAGYGGGIYVDARSPTLITLTYATFTSNTAFRGGGICTNTDLSSVALTHCSFSENTASGDGGGINFSSPSTLSDCSFTGNSASTSGGGFRTNNPSSLSNCVFSGNSSSSGGGLYNTRSATTLTNCAFIGNIASTTGGGIYNINSSPTMSFCTFSGNIASSGGGNYNNGSSPSLTNCTFTENSSNSSGGAIYNENSSSPTLTNCSLTANTASAPGGGIYNFSSSPTLINCTIVANKASPTGGGIYNSYSAPNLTNCILWYNGGAPIDGDSATVAYSNIEGGYAGTGNINADPSFVSSPWTGPDGVWRTTDDVYGDLRLRSTSPCLDIGLNSANSASTDLANNARVQNGVIDMGAYEGSFAATAPKIIYVDIHAVGNNTGESWNNAFVSLQSAILNASDADTIKVADGTYYPTSATDQTACFFLRNTVSIFGGYAGYGETDSDARDASLYPTILSGDIGTASMPSDNCYHVIIATSVGPSTLLDGIVVTLGFANGTGENQNMGGGMLLLSASPTLNNCLLTSNASSCGGAIYNITSSPTLTNCAFSGNSASSGAGLYNDNSSPTLNSCTFTGNASTACGGGIYSTVSSPTLNNCAFSGNTASTGGGFYNDSHTPNLFHCSFTGNTASASGGGMYINASPVIMTQCSFVNNSSISNGGGIYIDSRGEGVMTNCALTGNTSSMGGAIFNNSTCGNQPLINCSINGNTASSSGGGMYINAYWTIMTNCSIIGNTAPSGSAIYYFKASPTLTNCTIAYHKGVAIYNYDSSLKMINCILWHNDSSPIKNASGVTITYCDFEGPIAGTGNINADPCFVHSPWTGPDGVWGTADDDYGDLRLRSDSPCLNSGLNSANSTSTDIIGNDRIQSGVIDRGAYEGFASSSTPKTLFVDIDAAGNNSGSSWENAFISLQSAILAASDGDTIKVADGTYLPTTTADRTVSFLLRNAVQIQGGYAGFGASDPDARYASLYPTVLSGDIGIIENQSDNSFHIITSIYADPSTILDGLTITLGNANGSESNQNNGGGMICICNSSPTLNNCVFIKNSAASSGGGFYTNSPSCSPVLTHCVFIANTAIYYGGGANIDSAKAVFMYCSFTENVVGDRYAPGQGGGMCLSNDSTVIMHDCDFIRNAAPWYRAGAIFSFSRSITLMIDHCRFLGNSAKYDAGAIVYNHCSKGNVDITDSLFVGNICSFGGAGAILSPSNSMCATKLTNCTFAHNSSEAVNSLAGRSIAANCIFWNSASSTIPQIISATTTYCDVQGGYSGTANLNADPLFIRNPSPGADAVWGTADDDYGDLRLQAASPCINAGLSSANTSASDILGNPRFVGIIDIGACETPAVSLAGSSGDDSYVAKLSADGSTLLIWNSNNLSLDPILSCPLANPLIPAIDLGDGNDFILFDLSNGALTAMNLAHVENIRILASNSTSIALSDSQLTLNSRVIGCSGTTALALAGPAVAGLSLSGQVSLKLESNTMVIASGNAQSIRQYFFNASTGAKPSLISDTSTTLALLDNSKLHITSFAGIPLTSPFSQLLIQPATPADANLDGKVDKEDLLTVSANLGQTNSTWLNGDINQDGSVNLADLAIVQSKLSTPSSLVLNKVQIKAKTPSPKITPKHKTIHKPARKA